MSDETTLLPCPFCGGSVSVCVCIGDWYDENDEIDGDSYEWTIRHNDFHSKCDLRSFHVSGIYRTLDCAEANEQKQRLIATWNTRAELGSGTCECDGTISWEWTGPTTYYEHELSCGHVITSVDKEPPNFCEVCGAKVVSEC